MIEGRYVLAFLALVIGGISLGIIVTQDNLPQEEKQGPHLVLAIIGAIFSLWLLTMAFD